MRHRFENKRIYNKGAIAPLSFGQMDRISELKKLSPENNSYTRLKQKTSHPLHRKNQLNITPHNICQMNVVT